VLAESLEKVREKLFIDRGQKAKKLLERR